MTRTTHTTEVNLGVAFRMSGRVKLVATKVDGSGSRLLGDFSNMILDSGFDNTLSPISGIASGTAYDLNFRVGAGSAPEEASQVQLVSQIADVSAPNTGTGLTVTASQAPPFAFTRSRTLRFGAGVAAGVIAEVGVAWSPWSPLFCRALVRDVNGNPTTVEVLPDEYLDMTYSLTVYPDATDKSFSLNLSSGSHDAILRVGGVSPEGLNTGRGPSFMCADILGLLQNAGTGTFPTDNAIFSGALGPVNGAPSGVQRGIHPVSPPERSAYVAGTFTRDVTVEIPLTEGNDFGADGISVLAVRFNRWFGYQMSFDPPIPKTPTRIFKVRLRVTLGRA